MASLRKEEVENAASVAVAKIEAEAAQAMAIAQWLLSKAHIA